MNTTDEVSSNERADGPGAADCPASELDTLRAEVAALKECELRLVAETRNQQARARREMDELRRYAESDFARELLNVLDNLERAAEAAAQGGDARAIGDGVRMVHEQFLKALAARGIEPIDALGAAFDPGRHEALMQQPGGDKPSGTVLQQLARGWKMHDRVLRPARVVVST
jgi:molecular chaperone GrpE